MIETLAFLCGDMHALTTCLRAGTDAISVKFHTNRLDRVNPVPMPPIDGRAHTAAWSFAFALPKKGEAGR